MQKETDHTIAAFCHIPKTGGMTFHDMLRRNFGWGHLITIPSRGWAYSYDDLRRDLRLNPTLCSLGGHAMRPFVDFKELDHRIHWYTILRNPIERSISNYQHQLEKRGSKFDFHTWLRRDCNQNWHVGMLAGTQDLAAAKQILSERMHCFGVMERYHEFLLLLRHRMKWNQFNVTYQKPRNPPRTNDIRTQIKANISEYLEDLHKSNELDIALYEYAVSELYPALIQDYGEARMENDLLVEFQEPYEPFSEKTRRWKALFFEKGIYRPLMKLTAKPGE